MSGTQDLESYAKPETALASAPEETALAPAPKETALALAPEETALSPELGELLTKINSDIIEKEYFPDRYFKVSAYIISERVYELLNNMLNMSLVNCYRVQSANPCPSYRDIIGTIRRADTVAYPDAAEKIVYLFGGCVRDLVFNKFTTYDKINDIDINYTANYYNVVDSLFKTYPTLIISKSETTKYIVVGNNKTVNSEYLEGFVINRHTYTPREMECRCNSLSIYIPNSPVDKYYLVDPFNGEGLFDAENKIYHAPILNKDIAKNELWDDWVSSPNNYKLFFRMIKFKARGYSIDIKTSITILNFWKDKTKKSWSEIWKYLNQANSDTYFNTYLKDIFQKIEASPIKAELKINYEDFIKLLISKGVIPVKEASSPVQEDFEAKAKEDFEAKAKNKYYAGRFAHLDVLVPDLEYLIAQKERYISSDPHEISRIDSQIAEIKTKIEEKLTPGTDEITNYPTLYDALNKRNTDLTMRANAAIDAAKKEAAQLEEDQRDANKLATKLAKEFDQYVKSMSQPPPVTDRIQIFDEFFDDRTQIFDEFFESKRKKFGYERGENYQEEMVKSVKEKLLKKQQVIKFITSPTGGSKKNKTHKNKTYRNKTYRNKRHRTKTHRNKRHRTKTHRTKTHRTKTHKNKIY